MSNLENAAKDAAQKAEVKALGWWAQPVNLSKTTFIIVCIALFVLGAMAGHFGK